MPSLPPVSAKVIADAEQFVAEFRRAERAAKSSTSVIEREVGSLTTRLAKKFSLGDVGKDVLKGLGIGSGFAAAEQAAQMIVSYWKDAAEAAKSIEESTAKQLAMTLKMISGRQTPEQQLATMEAERDRLEKRLAEANRPKVESVTSVDLLGRVTSRNLPRNETAQEVKDRQALSDEFNRVADAAQEMKRQQEAKKFADAEAQRLSDQQRRIAAGTAGLKAQEDAQTALNEAAKKANDEAEKARKEAAELAEKYRELADPARAFKKELDEIRKLQDDGKLDAIESLRAQEEVQRRMAADEKQRVNAALDDFFGDMDDRQKQLERVKDTGKELGLVFTSAFEDAIVSGNKFSDVLRGLAQDLLRLMVRRNMTEPLLAAFSAGGKFAGISKIFGFADGGSPPVGVPSMVGERGPELFVPRTAGTIVPNHALGGGNTVQNFTYNFSSGVTRQELASILPEVVKASAGMVADRVGRGGAFRKAMA